MKLLLQIFKKAPFLTVLILSALIFALWPKNPIIAEIIKEHNQVLQKSKAVSIAYYYPYFPYFAGIVVGSEQPKKEWMDSYYLSRPYIFVTYYQKVVEMFPDNDAGHFLLGFCEYYKGNPDEARAQFEKSIALNPYFFWSYYDLGVIYFQQGSFLKSAAVLNKALSLKDEMTLEILHQGPFYWQIWQYIAKPPQIAENNLNQGKEDALALLVAEKTVGGQRATMPIRLF